MANPHNMWFAGLGGPTGKGVWGIIDAPNPIHSQTTQYNYETYVEHKAPPPEFRTYEKGRYLVHVSKFEGYGTRNGAFHDPFAHLTKDKRLTGKPHHISAYHWLKMSTFNKLGWRMLSLRRSIQNYPALTYTYLLHIIGVLLLPRACANAFTVGIALVPVYISYRRSLHARGLAPAVASENGFFGGKIVYGF